MYQCIKAVAHVVAAEVKVTVLTLVSQSSLSNSTTRLGSLWGPTASASRQILCANRFASIALSRNTLHFAEEGQRALESTWAATMYVGQGPRYNAGSDSQLACIAKIHISPLGIGI